jgi:hypothetical protein
MPLLSGKSLNSYQKWILKVPCPNCGAVVDTACETSNGHKPHGGFCRDRLSKAMLLPPKASLDGLHEFSFRAKGRYASSLCKLGGSR